MSDSRAEQIALGQTQVLTQTLKLLAAEPKLDTFLSHVLAAIATQLNTKMCALYFHDSNTKTLLLHRTYHYGQVLTGEEQLSHPAASQPFPDDLNAFWRVLVETQRPIVIPDIENDPLLLHHRWLSENNVKSLLIVPLLNGKETIGFLGIRCTQAGSYCSQEIELAQALTHQITLAVQLTRLTEQAQQSARQHAEELERRVTERTLELAKANSALQAEITERRRTEAALRVSETRFRTIFEQSPLSMQLLTPSGRTLQVNHAWEGLFGLGMPAVTDYAIAEDQQLVERGIMPYIHQGLAGEPTAIPPIFYDAHQTFGQGRKCWVQAFMYPVKDEVGNYSEVVLMHQDVTALKQAEQLARGQTEALTRTLNLLATEPDLDKFLGQVLKALAEQLGAKSAGFWLHEASQKITHLYINYDDDQIQAAAQSNPITSISSLVNQVFRQLVRDRRPYIFDDIANEPLLAQWRDYLVAKGIQSLLIVPLFLGDKYIGCFSVRSTEKRCYRPEELELAQALAHQATLAIQLTVLAEQGRQSAVLEERNRMAGEIHDTLAQAFTGILLQLGVAKRIVNQQPEAAWSIISQVSEIAQSGLAEARRSVWAMHPQAAEYSDLESALRRSLEQMTHTSVRGSICIQGTPRALPPDVGMNLLRIGQEALTNALRHAQAQEIWVELTFESQQVRLRVQDNGQGFNPQYQADGGGFGLIGMQQRADRIGGQLTISSQPGQGTEVMIKTPV